MRIFFSYSSKDKDFARRLTADLDRADMDVWLDEHAMHVGEDLSAIESGIRDSNYLVVALSTAAVESGWVDREIEMAQQFGVSVLPVLLEDIHGHRQSRFSGLSHADFRRGRDYRRAVQRLIATIEGDTHQARFLRAKEAVALVKSTWNPSGELFGISQQGVATLYSLANVRDWEFADATDGTSRFWIAEFFNEDRNLIQAYAVIDNNVDELPDLYLLGTDPEPLSKSITVFSCALNHLQTREQAGHAESVLAQSDESVAVSRRYSRFRPVVLDHDFVDSTVAVSAATAAALEMGGTRIRGEDLFILAKLECDKRYREFPTWIIAFFDPTLTESILTVGIDASTGAVLHPRMRTEILNADFLSMRFDEEGNIVLGAANQLRAVENHVWDIPDSGAPPVGMTAAEAMTMAAEFLEKETGRQQWQVAFFSNTGTFRTALSPAIPSPEVGLMQRGGRAGQWVVEVCGLNPALVTESDRHGYSYPFRQILCTRANGAVDTSPTDRLILTAALARTPLPQTLLADYELARRFAIQIAAIDFTVMSVALRRTPPEAEWHFRFYGSEDILTTVTVSVDGQRLIAAGPPHLA